MKRWQGHWPESVMLQDCWAWDRVSWSENDMPELTIMGHNVVSCMVCREGYRSQMWNENTKDKCSLQLGPSEPCHSFQIFFPKIGELLEHQQKISTMADLEVQVPSLQISLRKEITTQQNLSFQDYLLYPSQKT